MGAVRFTQGSRVSDSLSSDTEPCLETELLASNDRITLRYSPSLSHIPHYIGSGNGQDTGVSVWQLASDNP